MGRASLHDFKNLDRFFARHERRGPQIEDWGGKLPTQEDERIKQAEDRRVRIAELAATDPADVTLHIPVLKVDEINFEVNNLRARVALAAAVANLVSMNVGADVSVDRIKLVITGVEAQAILRAKLEKVAAIVERTLATIDNNPELLASLLRPVGELVGQVGHTVGETVPKLGEAVSDTVRETLPAVGETLRETAPAVAEVLREAAPAVGQAVRDTVPAVGDTVRDVAPAVGQTVRETAPRAQTVRRSVRSPDQTPRDSASEAVPRVGPITKMLSVVPVTAKSARRVAMGGSRAAFRAARRAARAARRVRTALRSK